MPTAAPAAAAASPYYLPVRQEWLDRRKEAIDLAREELAVTRAFGAPSSLGRTLRVLGTLERDEGEREPPCEKYPWDGVSGVRPYRGFAATTTVGVY